MLVVTLIFACAGGFYYLEWRAQQHQIEEVRAEAGETEERARLQASEIAKLQADLERASEPQQAAGAAAGAEAERAGRDWDHLSDRLRRPISKGEAALDRYDNYLVVTIPATELFDPKGNDLTPTGKQLLALVGRAVAELGPRDIFVGSHTDSLPIKQGTPGIETNWELSAARAVRVVRFLDEDCGVRRRRLTAAGYSDSRPVSQENTDEARARNRRIEIIIAPRILR